MKRKIISLVLALMVVFAMLSMTACNDNQGSQDNQGTTLPQSATMKLVLDADSPISYTVELDKVETDKGVISILEYLKNEKGLEYESDDSGYGAFLTKVGHLEQSGNTYIYLYTSVEEDMDVSEYATTIDFVGTTLYSSGVGASEMTIEPNCIIYIGTVTY